MCKALATAFAKIIPMPKNDDHSNIGGAEEVSVTSSLDVDHATKLSAIPSQAEIRCLLEAVAKKMLNVANSLGDKVRMACLESCINRCMYVCIYVSLFACLFVCLSL